MNSTTQYTMPYSDDFLVSRLLSNLEESGMMSTKKLVFTKPVITRKNKKTFIENFGAICNSLHRDSEAVRDYFEKSLALSGGDITLSATNVLTITGSHTDNNLLKHLSDYTMIYVICSEKGCGSGNTELLRENRILWLLCKRCNCKKAIQK